MPLDNFDIITEDNGQHITENFENAIALLQMEFCDAIYGSMGGILTVDDYGCLVYDLNWSSIYLNIDNYLGEWKLLKKKEF